MPHLPRTIGLILAGGRSRRMQGQDKTLLTVQGETLLAHVIHRLRPQVDALALNSNAAPDTFASYGLPVIPDRLPGFLGPLAGIHAGLMQYPEDCLVTVAVDLPFMPTDLVTRLRSGLDTKSCAYASDGERHALALLWRPGMAASVEDYLQHGGRKLKDYLAANGQPVRFDRPQDRGLFCNLNTPEDLARAERDVELLVISSAADEHR
ncbi:MAG TPA: molybdenum cofactor guanylyltransferase MobA [Acidiferrobacterales bacterium]|nr:molybdenum cofactor guanylyltransferase MobA [Acidiferrobacterales bacterium]